MARHLMIRRHFIRTVAMGVFGLRAATTATNAVLPCPSDQPSSDRQMDASANEEQLLHKVLDIHRYVGERMTHPKTCLIYNNIDWDADDCWEKADFESPEQVRSKEASNPVRANPDDCAIRAGAYVAALADWYDAMHSPECVSQAPKIFRGARTLYEVPPRKGFIARGVHPADGVSHPLNSSVDQYTWYVYGLWKYHRSELSSHAEKRDIKQIMHDICARIEEDGFDIRNTHGAPARVSDIGVTRSDRSSRLLEVYLVGYDITGDKRWLDIYRNKVAENGYARLKSVLDPEQVMWPYTRTWSRQSFGAVLQTQVSLVPLFELEKDVTLKACYLEAMQVNAKLAEAEPGFGGTAGLYVMLLAYKLPLIGYVDCPREQHLGTLLKQRCSETVAKSRLHNFDAAAAYWIAVRKGLFTARTT